MTGKGIRNISILVCLVLLLGGSIFLMLKLAGTDLGTGTASTAPSVVQAGPTLSYSGLGVSIGGSPHDSKHYFNAVCIGTGGQVWAGSDGIGVGLFDPQVGAWKWFTQADGLGDNYAYAIAVDHQGRVWVGHLNHGVSVFDGHTWKNYDAFSGPLGNRVDAIAVSPTDGDVWIATDCGLSRYSESSQKWSYFTRANGLPSNEISAITFDTDGNIYLGTQCEGVTIAARADGFQHWKTTSGPVSFPATPTGDGLPSNRITDIAFASDGTLLAATPEGLGISKDRGANWRYICGNDWREFIAGSINPPATIPSGTGATLSETRCNALAVDASGEVFIGHQDKGLDVFKGGQIISHSDAVPGMGKKYISIQAIVPMLASSQLVLATYAGGVRTMTYDAGGTDVAPIPAPTGQVAFPLPANPPSMDELDQAIRDVKALPKATSAAEYLGEDWETEGYWTGHLGHEFADLCAADKYLTDPAYRTEYRAGPHLKNSSRTGYVDLLEPTGTDVRYLYDPIRKTRLIGEWNDGSWLTDLYNETWNGPDEWVKVTVPPGIHRISLYFANKDGHINNIAFRDYLVELRKADDTIAQTLTEPVLARTRVKNFFGGVYKQFLVREEGAYWFRIVRHGAYSTTINAVMVDDMKPGAADGPPAGGFDLHPPTIAENPRNDSPTVQKARDLWAALDGAYGQDNGAVIQKPERVLAYRAALAAGADDDLLANWRWEMGSWNVADRAKFDLMFPVVAPPPARH